MSPKTSTLSSSSAFGAWPERRWLLLAVVCVLVAPAPPEVAAVVVLALVRRPLWSVLVLVLVLVAEIRWISPPPVREGAHRVDYLVPLGWHPCLGSWRCPPPFGSEL